MSSPLVVRNAANQDLKIFETDPSIEIHHDCVFVPSDWRNFWQNEDWGIYDSDGFIIDAGAYRSLPGMGLVGQSLKTSLDIKNIPYAPDRTYFYVGNMIKHYGHFICSSMVRLWAANRLAGVRPIFVGHCAGGPDVWFTWPYAKILLGAAGLVRDDFAHFNTPVRMRQLIVARPAFIEQNTAHKTFARAAHDWGRRLLPFSSFANKDEIAYISKSRYQTNPDGLSNESAIVEEMSDCGIPVYFPESLTIPDQISLFLNSNCLLGQVGSAFHTSLFVSGGTKIINIVTAPDVYSNNHALIDAINENNAEYLYFDGAMIPRDGANAGFEIADARACARTLIEMARA